MKRSMVGGRLLTGAIHRRCLVLLPSLSLATVLPGIAMVLPCIPPPPAWYSQVLHGILNPGPMSSGCHQECEQVTAFSTRSQMGSDTSKLMWSDTSNLQAPLSKIKLSLQVSSDVTTRVKEWQLFVVSTRWVAWRDILYHTWLLVYYMYMSHIIQTHLVQCHRLLMAFGHVWRQMLAPMMAPMVTNDGYLGQWDISRCPPWYFLLGCHQMSLTVQFFKSSDRWFTSASSRYYLLTTW